MTTAPVQPRPSSTDATPPASGTEPDGRELVLPTPPTPPASAPGMGLAQVLLPMVGGLGMVVFMLPGRSRTMLVAGVLMVSVTVLGGVGAYVGSRFGPRRAFREARENYLRTLDTIRDEVRAEGVEYRADAERRHPRLATVTALVCAGGRTPASGPMRAGGDGGFGEVRVATGTVPHPVSIVVPDTDADHGTRRAMEALARAHRVLRDCPLVLPLAPGTVLLQGDDQDAQACVRSVLVRWASAHPRGRLRIRTDRPADWSWARWLPHLQDDGGHVFIGPDVTASAGDLLVLHTAGDDLSGTVDPGVCVLQLPRTGEATSGDPTGRDAAGRDAAGPTVVLRVLQVLPGGEVGLRRDGQPVWTGSGESLPAHLAETCARALAASATGPVVGVPRYESLPPEVVLGATSPEEFRPVDAWNRLTEPGLLCTTIGVDEQGRPLDIDLKEAGHGGVGPHGLVVGATGSGKSELLRSLVLGLAARHHPDDLAFVLVDFKGGATFAGLEGLPHVAGLVTNLGDEPDLIDRMRSALGGEIRRRQQVLHDAGHLNDIFALRSARALGRSDASLPHLLLVVDEFAELLTAEPELLDLFTTIGRIGRSIGLHMLLASQRLDDGRLRGLESFLSYRFALRTFTPEESRAVIGTPDAAELPRIPGVGFLRTGPTTRFRAAYVSGSVPRRPSTAALAPVTITRWWSPADPAPDRETAASFLDTAVLAMRAAAPPTRRIWLPPLPTRVTRADLPGGSAADDPGRWVARIGLMDLPEQQEVAPYDLDLRRAGGHLVILGTPGSGRSTTLRTIAHALGEHHSPEDLVIHGVDLDGDGLRPLADLPHVGSVAGRADDALTRRIIREMVRVVDRHADGMPRRRHVLLLDGYDALRDLEDLHEQVVTLARRGPDAGVHVVLTAARWHDLRASLQTSISERLELRLAEPLDSVVNRRSAALISADTPGRGLTQTGAFVQIVLPGDGVDERTAYRAVAARHATRAQPVALLPHDARLPDDCGAAADGRLWVGVGEDDLTPVATADDSPHVVVVGDRGSGRTTLLRSFVTQVLRDPTAVVAVIDPRRRLGDTVPPTRLAGRATTASDAEPLVASLAAELADRADRAHLADERPAANRIVLVVDDAELVTGPMDPLAALVPFLALAEDLRFSVLLARHAGGAARSAYEPVMTRLREVGATGVLLSGPADEGPVWQATTMRPLPPGRAVLLRRGESPLLTQCFRP